MSAELTDVEKEAHGAAILRAQRKWGADAWMRSPNADAAGLWRVGVFRDNTAIEYGAGTTPERAIDDAIQREYREERLATLRKMPADDLAAVLAEQNWVTVRLLMPDGVQIPADEMKRKQSTAARALLLEHMTTIFTEKLPNFISSRRK